MRNFLLFCFIIVHNFLEKKGKQWETHIVYDLIKILTINVNINGMVNLNNKQTI